MAVEDGLEQGVERVQKAGQVYQDSPLYKGSQHFRASSSINTVQDFIK